MCKPPKLEGAPNFRDIGGYPATDDQAIRPGRLFRSQGLHTLTDSDLETLRSLDVRLVCDLRSERERLLQPSRWPGGMRTQHLDLAVAEDIRAGGSILVDMVRSNPGAGSARSMMIANYRQFPARFAPPLQQLFARLLSPDEDMPLPVLVHCSLGKDRTGFMIAMLLAALGVSRELIYWDYMETERCIDGQQRIRLTAQAIGAIHGYVPDRAALEVIAGVDAAYLDVAFASIESQYGTVANYLLSACGLSPVARDRFVVAMTQARFTAAHN
jgi:protein-tyrosine phosphatase